MCCNSLCRAALICGGGGGTPRAAAGTPTCCVACLHYLFVVAALWTMVDRLGGQTYLLNETNQKTIGHSHSDAAILLGRILLLHTFTGIDLDRWTRSVMR